MTGPRPGTATLNQGSANRSGSFPPIGKNDPACVTSVEPSSDYRANVAKNALRLLIVLHVLFSPVPA